MKIIAVSILIEQKEIPHFALQTAPVDIQSIAGTIYEKREALERMTYNLEVLNSHQSFILLKTAFAIPKL